MKYCRFEFNGQSHYGLVEAVAGVEQITRLLLKPPEEADGDIEDLPSKRMDQIGLAEATLLAPGGEIRRPKLSQRVDFEGELAVVIGKKIYQVRADEDVRPYILGYTCLNDVTARDLQNKDGQWTRAKGFDTFCPVGPLVTDEINPWTGVGVETRVNGDVRQQGNTRDFIFSLGVIIRYISQAMTISPGDVIATGTPKGVGPVVAGDVIEISVEGVGTLRNAVVDE